MEDTQKKRPNEIPRDPFDERMAAEIHMYLSDAVPAGLDTILRHARVLLELPEEGS